MICRGSCSPAGISGRVLSGGWQIIPNANGETGGNGEAGGLGLVGGGSESGKSHKK